MEQLEQKLLHSIPQFIAQRFNSKIIGAIWCTGQGESRILENIVVHPANRGRGVAERLVSEVCRMEEEKRCKKLRARLWGHSSLSGESGKNLKYTTDIKQSLGPLFYVNKRLNLFYC